MILAVRVAFLPGAAELAKVPVCAQMGSASEGGYLGYGHGTGLFSPSITGSGMIVYGAYLDD